MTNESIAEWRESVRYELFEDIIPFWCERSIDRDNGGFIGRMTNDLVVIPDAPKSLILHTRILWTFSALYRNNRDDRFRELADHGFRYFVEFFLDPRYGGAYWLLDRRGQVINNTKKIYGQAFAIFALSEYYLAFGTKEALDIALETFDLIERHNFDRANTGYFEASNRDWTIAEEMRLSERDLNERKSMNTHLHLMEAYTNLLRATDEPRVKEALHRIIRNFLDHIVDHESGHFILFFDDEWNPRSRSVSYGHEIEGSWLLTEAAREVGDAELIEQCREASLRLARGLLAEGLADDFGVYGERLPDGTPVQSLQWWQQAESVVGLINAYELSGDECFLDVAFRMWEFVEKHLVDRGYGEWFYEVGADRKPNLSLLKVCEWKGPYHNARACLEILRRLDALRGDELRTQKEPAEGRQRR